MSASAQPNWRGVTRLAIAFLILGGFYLFGNSWLRDGHTHKSPVAETFGIAESEADLHHDGYIKTPTSKSCLDVPGADRVMVMLKTGATELYQKLPTHFVTTFSCIPNFMIFSDLEQQFGDYPVYDAIAPISQDLRDNHADFELYRKLQQYQAEGQDVGKLSGDKSWTLDKWKFLPMMHQAFESAGPNVDWFVIMEADTSLAWINMLQWFRTMDPQKPYYIGAQNIIGDVHFAHGGSGIVISRRAADMLMDERNKTGKHHYDTRWEQILQTSCCGDATVGHAFEDVGVPITHGWPLIQGETVSSIDFTEWHWCSVAISWHHVTPIQIDAMWQFQWAWVAEHGWDTPFLHRDVFAHFIERHVSVNRTKWNNLSGDTKYVSPSLLDWDDAGDFAKLQEYEQKAINSEDECAQACLKKKAKECIQWMWSPGRCYLGRDIRFGQSDEVSEEGQHWTSGWIQERMEAFAEHWHRCPVNWHGV